MKLELKENQILQVVKFWYTKGMCPDIFQNEEGLDLEEVLEQHESINEHNRIMSNADELEELEIVEIK